MIIVSKNPKLDLSNMTSRLGSGSGLGTLTRYNSVFSFLCDDTFIGKGENWYDLLGRYIYNKCDDNLPDQVCLMIYPPSRSTPWGLKKSDIDENNLRYSGIAIYTMSSWFDADVLKSKFGNPVKHNQFGEGVPKSKYNFASYFIEIDNVKFHIGYDHRGTYVEVEDGVTPKLTFELIKKLIDHLWDEMINEKIK